MEDSELRFKALGTEIELSATGLSNGKADLKPYVDMLDEYEQLWSRFIFDSDVSRINDHSGDWVQVSQATVDMTLLCIAASTATDGVFNPLVNLADAGYDRTFEELNSEVQSSLSVSEPASSIQVNLEAGLVMIPEGSHLDFGGIAKGWLADHIAGEIKNQGATSTVVNVGGDVRVWSEDTPIRVQIELPGAQSLTKVDLTDGGVATSSTLKRRWRTPYGEVSHLRNPNTGTELSKGFCSATVISSETVNAEILTKVFISSDEQELNSLAHRYGCSGYVVTEKDNRLIGFGQLAQSAANGYPKDNSAVA